MTRSGTQATTDDPTPSHKVTGDASHAEEGCTGPVGKRGGKLPLKGAAPPPPGTREVSNVRSGSRRELTLPQKYANIASTGSLEQQQQQQQQSKARQQIFRVGDIVEVQCFVVFIRAKNATVRMKTELRATALFNRDHAMKIYYGKGGNDKRRPSEARCIWYLNRISDEVQSIPIDGAREASTELRPIDYYLIYNRMSLVFGCSVPPFHACSSVHCRYGPFYNP
ncbi:uncharacterized protein ARMOST_21746 [Armillaria ostoyae]|uniref:Uncharacterized protein n=1 Tax=Armillaria ostoyae TaxID=47428 RepID=A0A284SAX1_ARMOS|nr:uncharacterized protein ARMOST_21746 [Armillaria ostoyae]